MDDRTSTKLAVWAGAAALTVGVCQWAAAAPPPPPPGARTPDVGNSEATQRAPNRPPPRARGSAAPSGRAGSEAPKKEEDEGPAEDLSKAWSYSTEEAQGPAYIKDDRDIELTVNPIGFYQGVTATGENLPPHLANELGIMPAVLTWSGFERTQSSSRVFFQLSAEVPYELSAQGQLVSIRLPNTSASVRNNIRRLDTRYFRTPVTEVNMRRNGADMVVSLTLRREATPQVAMVEGENGYRILILEFADTDAESGAPSVQ